MLEGLPRVLIRSRCGKSRRLRAYFDEKGYSVRLEYFDEKRHGRELGRRNPRNDAPVFEQGDGLVLWSPRVILEYVEECAPDSPLMPRDPEGRARTRLLFELADDLLAPLTVAFAETTGKGRDEIADRIADALRSVAPHLSHEGPFAIGKRFTAADLTIPPILLAAIEDGFDVTLLPVRLRLWVQTVHNRPSVRKLFPDARLSTAPPRPSSRPPSASYS
jgi:glutathione S-transferase